ncbi:MAG: hypothetical protein KDD01_18325 [Phaeodactylibacter sp.]|nr:hypothetical protein [Phaeodactylibacter sp.]
MRKTIQIALLLFITLPSWAQRESTLTPEDKRYGLSNFWKEVSYNFAFFGQVPRLNWDSAYQAWGYWTVQEDPETIVEEWERKSIEYFNGDVWHEFEYAPDTNDVEGPKLVVPTVILTGHNTASAAEDFLVYLDNQPHITRLGRKTYGSTGQPLFLELPCGGSARICTKKDVFPDGREFVGYGIAPQIEVNPTVGDFIQDRDPALEKAVEVVKGKL